MGIDCFTHQEMEKEISDPGEVKCLELFPQSGRIVPEIGKKHIPEVLIGNYRILYSLPSETKLVIVTIHHSAQPLTL